MSDDKKSDLEEIMREAIASSVWSAPSIEEEPSVILVRWRAYQVRGSSDQEGDTFHFVGNTGYEGRVSSAIKQFDPITKKGVSKSGRIYQLESAPGFDGDADYVWKMWLRINGNPQHTDISNNLEGLR